MSRPSINVVVRRRAVVDAVESVLYVLERGVSVALAHQRRGEFWTKGRYGSELCNRPFSILVETDAATRDDAMDTMRLAVAHHLSLGSPESEGVQWVFRLDDYLLCFGTNILGCAGKRGYRLMINDWSKLRAQRAMDSVSGDV